MVEGDSIYSTVAFIFLKTDRANKLHNFIHA